jgi:hypothetical protein
MAKKKTNNKPSEPVVRVIYTIEEIVHEDGTTQIRRINHGVDSHRLHSILQFATTDVAAQIRYEMPPPQRIYSEAKK